MAKGKASRRQNPRIWLMTDPRLGDSLLASARALPRGSAIVLRHYDLDPDARRALFRRLHRLARQRGLVILLGGDARTARRWRADGVHGRGERGTAGLMHSAPVHDRQELQAAARRKAEWLLLSPVHRTRSHPGAPTLGSSGFQRLAIQASRRGSVIALGGMTQARFAMMRQLPVQGWAAIDALGKQRKGANARSDQKRISVPR